MEASHPERSVDFRYPWEHASLQECLNQGGQQISNYRHTGGSHFRGSAVPSSL